MWQRERRHVFRRCVCHTSTTANRRVARGVVIVSTENNLNGVKFRLSIRGSRTGTFTFEIARPLPTPSTATSASARCSVARLYFIIAQPSHHRRSAALVHIPRLWQGSRDFTLSGCHIYLALQIPSTKTFTQKCTHLSQRMAPIATYVGGMATWVWRMA